MLATDLPPLPVGRRERQLQRPGRHRPVGKDSDSKMARAAYDPGSSHWGRPPIDSMIMEGGPLDEEEDDEDDLSDPGDFRVTGSHLVDKYIKTMQARQSGDGAPVRHETPADFDVTILSESFEDANSTLGSHYSARRQSREYNHDFRATPRDLKMASPLVTDHEAGRISSRDNIRRGDGESAVNRSSGGVPQGMSDTRYSDASMLASGPEWYGGDETITGSVAARHLGQYNSLSRSHHDSSYPEVGVNRRQAGEADGASARHQAAPQAAHPQSQPMEVAVAMQGLTAQLTGERGLSTPEDTASEDIDYDESRDQVAGSAQQQLAHQRSQLQQGRSSAHQLSLHDVVGFLNSRDTTVVANAAGYLQHASYNNDHVKAQLRNLGAIPALVGLILQRDEMVQHAAVGVLRNMSYGPRSMANKYTICESGGVEVLVRLLRNARSEDVQELVTGVIWNLSSWEELKMHILSQSTTELVRSVIVPASGWDPAADDAGDANDEGEGVQRVGWTPVLRNATGILRNLSSAGPRAREILRSTEGLVDALLRMLRAAVGNNEVDNKSVENSMCILRNLSFRLESEVDEVSKGYAEDSLKSSNWEQTVVKERTDYEAVAKKMARKESKKSIRGWVRRRSASKSRSNGPQSFDGDVNVDEPLPWKDDCPACPHRRKAVSGLVQLFQPEVMQSYVALAAEASNPETLEAAAGAIQNLTACNWKWSVFLRNAVRKERGLPILSELLTIPSDAVVRTAATALRNLAVDPRNRELIGKFAMRDLVWRLPGEPGNENMSEATVGAVLCCIQELVSRNDANARLLSECKGIQCIVALAKAADTPAKLGQIANRTCLILSNSKEMRIILKQEGWMYSYFVSSTRSGEQATGDTATLHSISDSRANVHTSSADQPNNRSAAAVNRQQTPVEIPANRNPPAPASSNEATGRSQANIAALSRHESRATTQQAPRQPEASNAPANIAQQQDRHQTEAANALRQQTSVEPVSRQPESGVLMQSLSRPAENGTPMAVDDNSWV